MRLLYILVHRLGILQTPVSPRMISSGGSVIKFLGAVGEVYMFVHFCKASIIIYLPASEQAF
jgi:hypothetical protein